MTTDASSGRMQGLVDRLLERAAEIEAGGGRLTLTATLDLTPDSTGQPPVLQPLRRAIRDAAGDLDSRQMAALDDDVSELIEAVEDAGARGILGFVWVSHPAVEKADEAPITVMELASTIRSSVHVDARPHLFEVARAAYLDRPVVLVTTDVHTMDVVRVRRGTPYEADQVDYPKHWLRKVNQRTGRDAFGGAAGQGGMGHSYDKTEQQVEHQRGLFASEAAEALGKFVTDEDLFVIEGVDEARSQILGRLPESLASRAVQLPAPHPNEEERDRFARLRALAYEAQFDQGAQRAERFFAGGEANAIRGLDAIETAVEQGRVATVIVHEDAEDHMGSWDDVRFRESTVDGQRVERILQQALRQGAVAIFTQDQRVLDEGGLVAVGRY